MNYFLPIHCGAPDYKKSFLFSHNPFYWGIEKRLRLRRQFNSSTTNSNLGQYLAGLFEGDGHVSLPKVANLTGKITYPYLAITFVNKDLPLVNQLKELYGGRLRFKTEENAIVWIIGTHKELIVLIDLKNLSLP